MDTSVDCTGCPGITVTRVIGRARNSGQRVVRILSGFAGAARYGVHNSSLRNLARGIVERVLFTRNAGGKLVSPVKPKDGVFKRLKTLSLAVRRCTRSTTVVSVEDYPSLYHCSRKRALYERAAASLNVGAITRRDSHVSTFVKAEKVNFTAKPDPAPRVIQPRDPRYNLMVGRYLKPFEKNMFDAVALCFGYKVVCKGLNAEGTALQLRENWEHYRSPVAIGLDASRFDQHVSREALEFEHSYYNSVFNSPELERLLSWQLINKGVGWTDEGKVSYTVNGCRMSGDINTSMGNCYIMSLIVLGYFQEKGVAARLANNGDDCVVICESSDLHKFDAISDWFTDFGFKLTREEPVYEFERIEFCQTQPVLTGSGWRMVRNPFTAMSKDTVSLLSWANELEFDRWRGAISSCGLSLTRGVPVWEAFYQKLGGVSHQQSYDRVSDSGLGYMAKGVIGCDHITAESRFSFWRAFGITPDEQVALESLDKEVAWCGTTPVTFGEVNLYHELIKSIKDGS